MNSFDGFTLQLGFVIDNDAKLVLTIAAAVIGFVLVARFVAILSQLGGGSKYDAPTPTTYVPRRDDWRAETAKTEQEIAYLVKQVELQETREWLARRNK